ncbi:tyrosine-type recombinase/integrase [Crocosphaera sp. XPORK-15E]|uniref:tyrosine-type recombinase/integrase n=1 Tax=Crocosphaera sp. XPORK-15E TaxID=3110247 RepID=UPI002B20CCDF|nr:tyrosine-type recombinase/integrase [Crocosphaera sp. XPORK-15E]MEA5537362.1 tyrosine-type recombinase/integrase [Crocosphaera sp. XPORK-15E]
MSALIPLPSVKPILAHPPQILHFFDEFLATDVGEGAAASDTLRTYRCHLKQFLNWCQTHQVHPIEATFAQLKQYRHWLIETQQYQQTTISLKLSVLRRFYDALLENDYINSNPALRLRPPREVKDPAARINYLQNDEMYQLLDALPEDNSVQGLRDRLLISIMVLEGCRTVEMHRVNVGDIVKDGPNVGLRVWAKRSIRVVPLTPELGQLLRRYLAARKKAGENLTPDTPVLISVAYGSKGERLSRRSVRRIVDKYLGAIGLKDVPRPKTQAQKRLKGDSSSPPPTPRAKKSRHQSQPRKLSAHSLRHTAGTLALRTGASLRQVQDLLGHADPRTTVLYAHIGDRWVNNPALQLEKRGFG